LLLADPSIKEPFLRQVLEDLKSEVKKMTNLVSDLLMVARSDNNALKVKIQRLDLTEILKQVIRTMTPIAEKKNIHLSGENFRKVLVNADEQNAVYFDAMGRRTNAQAKGLLIKQVRMADGTVKTVKMARK